MNKASIVIILIIVGGIVFAILRPDSSTQNNGTGTMGSVNLNLYDTIAQVGTAQLTDENGKTKIVVTLSSSSSGTQPASIRAGNCAEPGDVRYQLNDIVNGKSETILAPAMHFIHGLGDSVITVQKSSTENSITAACGNLREAFDNAAHQMGS